jgi:hypothetical protein
MLIPLAPAIDFDLNIDSPAGERVGVRGTFYAVKGGRGWSLLR